MPYALPPPQPAKPVQEVVNLIVDAMKKGPLTCRQMEVRLKLTFKEARDATRILLRNDARRDPPDRRYKTEWRQVGDGRGQPAQELVYSFKPKE